MAADRHSELRRLFVEASSLPADERDAFLVAATGDGELRGEVRKLLSLDSEPTGALDRPLVGALGAALEDAIETAAVEARVPFPEWIGPYRIRGVLGRGGMGIVYEAEQESPARRVALKVLRPDVVTPAMLRRFEHESLVLGRLNHPGIAQIFDAGTAVTEFGTQPFLAMELVRGVPLTSYAERKGLSRKERLDLLSAVAVAVHHAHQRSIVHRDLKPANVLVDGEGHIKILDFGVAATLDAESHVSTMHTDVGEVVGTLSYMSPEQVTGRSAEVDARSDVYALGVLAHELFTGRPPFDLRGKLVHEAARIVAEDDPSTLGSLDSTLRGDVEWIVGKALEKEPSRRYASADAFAEDIRRHLTNQPIAARSPSVWYQAVKFTRRNRAFVGGLIATLIALLIGLTVSTSLYLDSRERGIKLADSFAKERDALREAEAVTGFMAGILQAASPEREDRELTVVELLERSAPDIDESFEASPRVAARLHGTVAIAFEELGAVESAVRHARRVYDLRRADPDGDLAALNQARLGLGRVLSSAGETEEADQILVDGLASETDPARRASLLVQQSKNEKNRGRIAEARARLEDALALIDAGGVPESTRFDAWNQQAILLARTGHLEEARQRFESVLAWRVKEHGEDHPLVLDGRHNLATALSMMGRHDEVLALDKQILDTRRRVLGDLHRSTLNSTHSIGEGLVQLGRFQEAEPHLRSAVEGRTEALGSGHVETLTSRGGLARCLDGLGRVEEARGIYAAAVEEAVESLGEIHWVTVLLTDNFGATLRALGEFDKAVEHHRRAAAAAQESLGTANLMTIIALGQLTATLDVADRHAEAIEAGEEALRLAASPTLASPVSVTETRARLMQIYLRAEPAELQDPGRVLELGQALGSDPANEGPAWAILADAQARLNRYDEALKSLDFVFQIYPDSHPDLPGLRAYREVLIRKSDEAHDDER